ncbi:hypothetical protein HK100_004110, partial [Physocladia obscura]
MQKDENHDQQQLSGQIKIKGRGRAVPCGNCRLRRRACDLSRPSCGRCVEHNLECEWPAAAAVQATQNSKFTNSVNTTNVKNTAIAQTSTAASSSDSHCGIYSSGDIMAIENLVDQPVLSAAGILCIYASAVAEVAVDHHIAPYQQVFDDISATATALLPPPPPLTLLFGHEELRGGDVFKFTKRFSSSASTASSPSVDTHEQNPKKKILSISEDDDGRETKKLMLFCPNCDKSFKSHGGIL